MPHSLPQVHLRRECFPNRRGCIICSKSGSLPHLTPTLFSVPVPCVLLCHFCNQKSSSGCLLVTFGQIRSRWLVPPAQPSHLTAPPGLHWRTEETVQSQSKGGCGEPWHVGSWGSGLPDALQRTANAMRRGHCWGHTSGTRITLGHGDPSLALGPHCRLEHPPVG